MLRRLGLPFQAEPHIGPFAADFQIGDGRRRIVLECDGTLFHDVRDFRTGRVVATRASDRLKHNIFSRRGFVVRRIHSELWTGSRDRVSLGREVLGL